MAGAEPGRVAPRARRRSSTLVSAVAALLLLGGGAAVAVGLHDQTPAPPAPHAAGQVSGPGTSSPSAGTTPGSAAPATSTLRPVHVRIPAVRVSSRLIVVGQHADGTLEVPQPGPDYDKAAWFRGSPAPGQVGPAVIEGHVDGRVDGPSVFYRLGAVKPGDTVDVKRSDGSRVRFVVYAVRVYEKDAFPRLTVYGNTAGPELRLITCGGPFDRHRKVSGYTSNVVVFARTT